MIMELVNSGISAAMGNSSWIRRMFEAGLELKKQYGADAVYDFSLGNPDLPPPPEVKRRLAEIAEHADEPFAIGYMPNAGFTDIRELVAKRVSLEQRREIPGGNVIMTCGAAGGLNVFFRAVLEPGDEVIVPTPYFVEYDFYAGNYGGKLVKAPAKELTFELDLAAFERAFSPRTRAVIINSPNNPTGRIYTRNELEALARLIRDMEKKYDRAIYLISDEPYRFLNFAGEPLTPVMGLFPHAVVIGSYSKNLSLAGERFLEQIGEILRSLETTSVQLVDVVHEAQDTGVDSVPEVVLVLVDFLYEMFCIGSIISLEQTLSCENVVRICRAAKENVSGRVSVLFLNLGLDLAC